MVDNAFDTRFLLFTNSKGVEYLYSGLSGLVLENTEFIKEIINDPNKIDTETSTYLFDDPFINCDHAFFHKKPFIDTLTVFITNQCNLNCSYCFEKVNGVDKATKLDIKTFKDGISFFLSNFTYDKIINIVFFGGEPLLNFTLIKDAVEFLEQVETENSVTFTYSITTNGTLLNQKEIKEFLIVNNFNVAVSIDVDEQTHDKTRTFYNGKGSYKIVAENIKELSKYIEITARVTLTNPDINFITLCEDLHNIGAAEIFLDFVSTKNKSNEKVDFTILSENMKKFSDYYLKCIKERKLLNIKNFTETLFSIHYGSRKTPKYFPCDAGVSYYSLASNGDIYPCHRFNNTQGYKHGNIYENFNNDKRLDFLTNHLVFVRNSGICMNCWAKYLCGGTCYNASYYSNDDSTSISETHCNFKKEIIKNSLYIYASLNEDEKGFLENIM